NRQTGVDALYSEACCAIGCREEGIAHVTQSRIDDDGDVAEWRCRRGSSQQQIALSQRTHQRARRSNHFKEATEVAAKLGPSSPCERLECRSEIDIRMTHSRINAEWEDGDSVAELPRAVVYEVRGMIAKPA